MANPRRRRRDSGTPIVSPSTFRRLRKRSGADVVAVVFARQGEDGAWMATAEAGHAGNAPPEAFEAAVETLRTLGGNLKPSVLEEVGGKLVETGIALGAELIRKRYTRP